MTGTVRGQPPGRAGLPWLARRTSMATRGSDLRYNLRVTLEDAYRGLQKTITVPTALACSTCKAAGRVLPSGATCNASNLRAVNSTRVSSEPVPSL